MNHGFLALLAFSTSIVACGGAAQGDRDGVDNPSTGHGGEGVGGEPGSPAAAGVAGASGAAATAGFAGTGVGGDSGAGAPGWGGSCGAAGYPGVDAGPAPTPVPGHVHAIALLGSQIPATDPPQGGTGGSGGGSGFAPNDLHIHLGSEAQLCEAPFAAFGCGQWSASFVIPADRIAAGARFLLDGTDIIAVNSASGPAQSQPDDCWFGGGSFFAGSLELVSVDDMHVVIRVAGADAIDFTLEGEFTAPRCR